MSNHTAGPWSVTSQSEAGRYISVTAPHPEKNGRKTICRVPFSSDPGPYSDDADARLIAAAPELLAALKDLVSEADQMAKTSSLLSRGPVHDRARAAIAKAEGR